MLVAGLARIGNFRIIQGVFWQQGHKRVGVIVAGFGTHRNSRHMAADAVAERMDRMCHVLVNYFMTHQTLLRTGPFSLKLSRGHAQLMDVVAGRTCDTFLGVGGKLPAEILLVVTLCEIVSVDVLNIPVVVMGGFKVQPQGLTGLIRHRPFDIFYLG